MTLSASAALFPLLFLLQTPLWAFAQPVTQSIATTTDDDDADPTTTSDDSAPSSSESSTLDRVGITNDSNHRALWLFVGLGIFVLFIIILGIIFWRRQMRKKTEQGAGPGARPGGGRPPF